MGSFPEQRLVIEPNYQLIHFIQKHDCQGSCDVKNAFLSKKVGQEFNVPTASSWSSVNSKSGQTGEKSA